MRRCVALTVLVCLLGCIPSTAGAVNLEGNQAYDKLPGTVVTPHIPWAKPYYRGSLKTLVIAPTWTQRETVELAQRLSLDYSPLMTFSETDFFKPTYAGVTSGVVNQVAKERLQKDYDLIIIGKVSWSTLPTSVRYGVLKKVHEGAGLVYISPKGLLKEMETLFSRDRAEDSEGFITGGVPLSALPVVGKVPVEKLILLNTFGKGRIARLEYGQGKLRLSDYSYHSLTPFGVYKEPSVVYDYYHSLLAKVCLWAAQREPDIYIKGIALPGSPVARKKLPGSVLKVGIASREASSSAVDISLVIRDWKNVVEHEESVRRALRPGAGEVSFKLPLLKDGLHFCDVWFRKDGKVVNWGSATLEVRAALRIERVLMDKPSYEVGEKVTGRLQLSGPLPPGVKLKVEISDNRGRVVGRQVLSPAGSKASFAVSVIKPLTTLLVVRAVLDAGDGDMDEAVEETLMPLRQEFDYSFVVWDFANNDYILQAHLGEYEKHGVDTVLASWPNRFPTDKENEEICWHITRANLAIIPYIEWFGDEGGTGSESGPDGPVRKLCFTDPAYRKKVAEGWGDRLTNYGLINSVGFLKKFGPPVYSLGDENVLSGGSTGVDICFSRTCMADFRKYARRVYGSLEALNKEWETSYTDWSQVKPMTVTEATKQQNYPPWVDHRMHMDEVYAGIHAFGREVIRSVDPGARAGWHGTYSDGSIYRGYDLYKLYNVLEFKNSNTNPIGYDYELQCSYTREGDFSSMTFGSYEGTYVGASSSAAENTMRHHPWLGLFHKSNAAWWWAGFPYNGCGGASVFTPDYAPLPGFAQAAEEIREIKRGIGKLLLSSRRDDSGIAIHQSRPSKAVLKVYRERPTTVKESFQDFRYALEELGFQYYCMHREELEAGKLAAGGFRALVLPYSQAISRKEAEEIKKFVRGGGCVITDFDPAVTDEHGKVLGESSLKELFPEMDTSYHKTTFGKGTAYYLGDKRRSGELAGLVSRALVAAGVQPPVAGSVLASGAPLRQTEVTVFRDGGAEYVCLLRKHRVSDLSGWKVRLESPRKAHVYDVREKKYLGETGSIETMLHPARAKVFARLPYRVTGLGLRLEKARQRQGQPVNFTVVVEVSGGKPLTHVVRAELYGPGGKEIPHYAQNVLVRNGTHSAVIPLALNEATGTYRMVVTDVATGVMAKAEFTVTSG